MATVALGQRDYARAGSLAGEALRLFEEIGDRGFRAETLEALASAALGQDDTSRAAELLKESLTLAESVGFKSLIGEIVTIFGQISEALNQPRRAVILLEAGETALKSLGTSVAMWPWSFGQYQQCLARTRAKLGEAEFGAAAAEGRAMSLEQAVQYALGQETV